MRKEAHAIVAPTATSAKIGMPAREMVSRIVTAAMPEQRRQNFLRYFGKFEAAAAKKTGAVVHRYIERLFGSSKLPVTR